MPHPKVGRTLASSLGLIKDNAALSNIRSADQPFCGYHAISFPSVTQVLPSAIFRAIWYKRKTRYLIETAGFYLVAGARFELTTFRL
jgi:hypothetical protein